MIRPAIFPPRFFWLTVAAAGSLVLANAALRAQTWTNAAGGNWSVGSNWSGGVVPTSGPTTQLNFPSFLSSSYTATNDTGINPFVLNGLTLNNESSSTLTVTNAAGNGLQFAGTKPFIAMNGETGATISGATGTSFDLAGQVTIGGTGSGGLTIASSITGVGSLVINRPNSNFVGGTGLSGNLTFAGPLILQAGGLSFTSTSLGNGTLIVATVGVGLAGTGQLAGFTTLANPVLINSGATLNVVTASTITFNNGISGAGGGLSLGTQITVGSATLQAANTYGGATTVIAGRLTLSGLNGSITSGMSIDLFRNATLSLDNITANNPGRLPSAAVIDMARSAFTLTANSTVGNNAAQTIDTINGQGQATIQLRPTVNTAAVLTVNNFNRVDRGTFFAGALSGTLGGIPGNNVATILISSINGAPPANWLVGNGPSGKPTIGIIPFISSTNAGNSTFATYDSVAGIGVRPLNLNTEVVSTISLSSVQPNPALNVRVTVPTPGLAVPVTINSLVMSSANFFTNTGIWGFGGATGSLAVVSGAVMASGGTTLSPCLVNIGTINLDRAEGQFIAATSGFIVNSRVVGSNGITISSHASTDNLEMRLLNANNSFSGQVTINFGVLGVLQNANLGAAANPITLNGGQLRFIGDSDTMNRNITVGAAGGAIEMAPFAALGLSPAPPTSQFSRTLTVSGNISGTGSLVINGNPGPIDYNNPTTTGALTGGIVALTGNNSGYSGLPNISSGIVSVDNIDARLGAGPNLRLGPGQLTVTGTGPQTTAKNVYLWTPGVLGNGGSPVIVTAPGADLIVTGFVTDSGSSAGLTKSGPGMLTLTNTATYQQATTIGPPLDGGPASIAGGTLTLTNNGAITKTSFIRIYEGATLALRNDGAANLTNRLANVAVGMSGGTLSLVGATRAPSTETVGGLSVFGNLGTTISVAPGAGHG
jgi:hypothetical protein